MESGRRGWLKRPANGGDSTSRGGFGARPGGLDGERDYCGCKTDSHFGRGGDGVAGKREDCGAGARAAGRIGIMAGGNVRPRNLQQVVATTGPASFIQRCEQRWQAR
jgi:hypothetical protein